MSDWQPIETAPKDGTVIRIRQGRWSPHHARWKDGYWQSIEYTGTQHPTHWMPLRLRLISGQPVGRKAQDEQTK
jgi:hypothetical protein